MRLNTIINRKAMKEGWLDDYEVIPRGTALEFCMKVFIATKNKVRDFIIGLWNHWESVVILTLSSFGLTFLMGEIPFWLTLPWWIESPLLIPVLSVLIILALVSNGERRMNKREAIA